MKQGFMMPKVTTNWKKFRSPETKFWMVSYVECLHEWQYLIVAVQHITSLIQP